MKQIEILAPAGSMEALIAAVRTGANAVYLGGQLFSARHGASNFDLDEIEKAVDYCHKRNVKVYLALNTILTDGELGTALELAKGVTKIGIDAFIVQDLGLARLLASELPHVPLHASTQMAVLSVSGFLLLEKMGFKRAVMPREMSKSELEFVKANTSIDMEMFVHGAHCMSVSGQCYMSALLGSRSGNRGRCAQPCRLPFSTGESVNCLSLKDLSLISKTTEIEKMGITSLKIEGRMKRPEYVAAAVTACKNALAGSYTADEEKRLADVFSRGGFTSGYYDGKISAAMLGTRQKEDVQNTAAVLKELAGLYHKEMPLIEVTLNFTCKKGSPMQLNAHALGHSVAVSGQLPQAAKSRATTPADVQKQLEKCGSTQFYVKSCSVELDDGLFIAASEQNALRRSALSALEEKIAANFALPSASAVEQKAPEQSTATAQLSRSASFASVAQIPENADFFNTIYVPLQAKTADFEKAIASFGTRIGVELPRGVFGDDAAVKTKLQKLRAIGIHKALCPTLSMVAVALAAGLDTYADSTLNVFNSAAANSLAALGVKGISASFEMSLEKIARLNAGVPLSAVVYGRLPLMAVRCCPIKINRGCTACAGSNYVTDRLNINFPVMCHTGCATIYNSRPVYLAERMREISGVSNHHYLFTTESRDECETVINQYKTNTVLPNKGSFTRGLYYRGVL